MNLSSLFNLQAQDLWVILLVMVLLIGFTRLPQLARSLGQARRELMRARDEFAQELTRLHRPTTGDEPSHLSSRVLIVLAVLAGVISIAVAMET